MWSSASPSACSRESGSRHGRSRARGLAAFVNDVEPQRELDFMRLRVRRREPFADPAAERGSDCQPGEENAWLSLTKTDGMRSTGTQNPPPIFRRSAGPSGEASGAASGVDSLLGMRGVNGLHHVTAISGPAQENLDFYAGVLGMRLVKRSVNQDDPGTYHLFYADAEGHAGTDLTFFPWAHMAPSRDGHGLATEVSLAVPAGTPRLVGRAPDRLRRHRRRRSRRGSASARCRSSTRTACASRWSRAARRRTRLHAVGGQPGARRAPDPRPARRPRRRARSRRAPPRCSRRSSASSRTPPRATGSAS